MRFKIDENLPVEVAERLCEAQHDAMTVHEQRMGGHADRSIAAIVQDEKRALITLDLDFADIRIYPPADYFGLIVLRLRAQDKPKVMALIERVVPQLACEPLEKMLWIVDETAIRIRS
jgi:predicted nuclease of predicted toxin-antitoxin system